MTLRLLFGMHAVITCAAGIVLVTTPSAIPSAVGIQISREQYLLGYLLAAAEFAIATLSWGARSIADPNALRVISTACIVFHAASGMLEAYAFIEGVGAVIWSNIALRAFVVALFAYYGLRPSQPVN